MDYLLKASGIVIILFLFYYIFLKNETFFKSIRSYFLVGLLIVVSIPLIEIPVYIESIATQLNTLDFQEITTTQFIEESTIDWIQIFTYIYLFGVAFFSVKFLIQLISLGYLLSKYPLIRQGNYYYVETSKNVSPFSFFTIIIYNKSQFSMDELEQIINHEKAHVLQWHSVDTFLAHLLLITLWFNPFVWLYRKAVQQNLEFLADAYAIELANNQKQYQLILLKTCNATYCTELTNNFYNSLIKKRIVMIHKNKSKNNSQWKYALLLPLLVAFVFTFNTKIIAQEKELIEVEETTEINSEVIVLVLDKNTTKEGLDKIKQRFKDDADISLTFKGIKRNSDNEITAIKIAVKGKEVSANYSSSSSEPITPIKISYNSGNNSISIGNAGNHHEKMYTYTIHEKEGKHLKGKHDNKGSYLFITSDGKKKTWTTDDGKFEHIIIKEIHIDGDKSKIEYKIKSEKGKGENVWVHKKDKGEVLVKVIEIKEGKHKIKVIEESDDIHFGDEHEIEIIKEKEGENVFIIRKGDKKTKMHKLSKMGDFTFLSSDNEKSLIYIDGKESTYEEMKALGKDKIETIEVLKGEKAIEKYGEKAKDGVILITTKKD